MHYIDLVVAMSLMLELDFGWHANPNTNYYITINYKRKTQSKVSKVKFWILNVYLCIRIIKVRISNNETIWCSRAISANKIVVCAVMANGLPTTFKALTQF